MLFFIDESWQQSEDKKHKAGVLSAISIGSDQFNKLSVDVINLKRRYLGYEAGGLELKGHINFKRYYFRLEKRGVKSSQLNLARDLFDLWERTGIKAIATVTFPEHEVDLACADPNQLERPFFFLFERINQLMKESHGSRVAKLIFDDRGVTTNQRISKAVSNFFHKSAAGRSFDRILKVPLFAISGENVGIQIADMVGYIIGRRFTGDKEMTMEFFRKVKTGLQYKSLELVGKSAVGTPANLWGIKVIRKLAGPGAKIENGTDQESL